MVNGAYDLSRLSVLVVDSSALMRELIRSVLREFNIRDVEEAASLERALDLLKRMSFDLVMVDWAPDFDGLSLLKHIRKEANAAAAALPVIVMSAHSEAGHVAAARDAGANSFLAKPVTATQIYRHIATEIEAQRLFVRATQYVGPDRRRRRKNVYGGEERRHADDAESKGRKKKTAEDPAGENGPAPARGTRHPPIAA